MSRRTLMLAIVCFSWVALAAVAAYNLDDPNLKSGADLEIQSFSTVSREALAAASDARTNQAAQLVDSAESVDRLNADLAAAKPR